MCVYNRVRGARAVTAAWPVLKRTCRPKGNSAIPASSTGGTYILLILKILDNVK